MGTVVLIMSTVEQRPLRSNKKKSTTKQDHDLLECLFGKTRRSILTLLFSHTDESFHLRKILRLAGVLPGAGQRELKRLSSAGFILRTMRDNQVHFQANPQSPVFEDLKNLIIKTAGLVDVLRSALAPLGNSIKFALLYGSMAQGSAKMGSDVDLLIIGDLTFSDVVEKLGQAQGILRREINPTVMSPSEFQKRMSDGDHFLGSVLKTVVIPVMGESDEFTRLDKKRVAD